MIFRHGMLSRRDAFLLLIGASTMHIWSVLFYQPGQSNIFINTHVSQQQADVHEVLTTTVMVEKTKMQATAPTSRALAPFDDLPATELLAHAPGWTLFRNLYMSNGTIFIVADEAGRKKFPAIPMMTSTGLVAHDTPENIAAREPTEQNMRIISPKEASKRWTSASSGKGANLNRVWSVEGNTLLFNDPSQFLRHYYHLVAELFFGVQAFWHGAFSGPLPPGDLLNPSAQAHYTTSLPPAPPIHRAIFAHSNADGWRDQPDFNAYFLRAALPSLAVEHEEDWNDRIRASRGLPGNDRAWHFPVVLFVDRSAAFRGAVCGAQTQRTAAEAWDYMRLNGKLLGIHAGGWWAPLREAVWRFAGAEEGVKKLTSTSGGTTVKDSLQQQHATYFGSETPEVIGLDGTATVVDPSKVVDVGAEHQDKLPMPDKVVITYISRQSAKNRKLIKEDHEGLVKALEALVKKKNEERRTYLVSPDGMKKKDAAPLPWELAVLQAEKLTKDEQVKAAARTTIMLGVHGNGLTHLVFMDPKRVSTVIEIFYPGGFAHDYQWTTRSLGMSHFAVWNDTYRTHPNKPKVDYPEGFQLNAIPVHGPTIAQLVEDRVAGKL